MSFHRGDGKYWSDEVHPSIAPSAGNYPMQSKEGRPEHLAPRCRDCLRQPYLFRQSLPIGKRHHDTSFQSFVLSLESDVTLHLVIPHDPYLECDTAESVLELWWYSLLDEKWAFIFMARRISETAYTLCIFWHYRATSSHEETCNIHAVD